jgi:hypothetical protein
MVEDALDDRRVGDEGDDAHLATALGADQGIDFVHPADQLSPASPTGGLLGRHLFGDLSLAQGLPEPRIRVCRKEMDEVNPTFPETDVAIVIVANDVMNPVPREAENPIAGMPILDVDKAKTCLVVKRSLSPGFAGIPNSLLALPHTLMLFGDGKKATLIWSPLRRSSGGEVDLPPSAQAHVYCVGALVERL